MTDNPNDHENEREDDYERKREFARLLLNAIFEDELREAEERERKRLRRGRYLAALLGFWRSITVRLASVGIRLGTGFAVGAGIAAVWGLISPPRPVRLDHAEHIGRPVITTGRRAQLAAHGYNISGDGRTFRADGYTVNPAPRNVGTSQPLAGDADRVTMDPFDAHGLAIESLPLPIEGGPLSQCPCCPPEPIAEPEEARPEKIELPPPEPAARPIPIKRPVIPSNPARMHVSMRK